MWKEVGRGKKCLLAVSVQLTVARLLLLLAQLITCEYPLFLLPLSLIDDDDEATSAQPLNCFSSAD